MHYKNWFFDFDDTLATGNKSWSFQQAFPKLIQRHQLKFDEALFQQAFLKAQEHSSSAIAPDPMPILEALFKTMGWSLDLRDEFLQSLESDYVPEMFEDVLPLMQHLKKAGCRIFVISNNPHIPMIVEKMPLQAYVEKVFTPKICECAPKPDPGMWQYITRTLPELEPNSCVVVGDDPWSEGVFAQNCHLACWIVDRLDRFSDVQQAPAHMRVRSLAEIVL